MANNELNLLPCPWCGNTPDASNPVTFQLTDGVKYGAVQCCGSGPEVRTGYQDVSHWKDDAIEAWNERRAPAQAEPSDALPGMPQPAFSTPFLKEMFWVTKGDYYTADQMRAYAKQAIESRGGFNDADRGNIELVIARLEQIAEPATMTAIVIDLAEDALVCARAIESRILGQQGGSDAWQPIETAPKDGTNVLLFLGSPWNSVETAYWFPLWENWQRSDDRPDHIRDEYCGIGSNVPTHWQPIPAPPIAAIQAQAGDATTGGAA